MTANADITGAVEAMKLGALDYLAKPFEPAEMSLVVARARRAKQNRRLQECKRRPKSAAG